MNMYVHPPQAIAMLPIEGSEQLYPVHRIYCVGQNYAEHTIEMGYDPNRDGPVFFQKNTDNLITDGGDFPYPSQSLNVHHELELVVALGSGGSNIALHEALDCVFGYAVGLDMTRRNLQIQAKKLGQPWETSKAFESSAPCSAIAMATDIGHPAEGKMELTINKQVRQRGNLDQMVWKPPEIIANLSTLFDLKAGDLIMTGTPGGAGPVSRGDVLEGQIEGVGLVRTRVY